MWLCGVGMFRHAQLAKTLKSAEVQKLQNKMSIEVLHAWDLAGLLADGFQVET